MKSKLSISVIALVAFAFAFGTVISANRYSEWGDLMKAPDIDDSSTAALPLNTIYNDGCPIEAPDALHLFIASNRPGTLGGQDLWVATRETVNSPWGEPKHLPAPINSERDDFCPTPVRGHGLYFVSRRHIEGVSCGVDTGPTTNTDIFFTRYKTRRNQVDWENPDTWEQPQHLGCDVNSPYEEWSPSFFEGDDGNQYLYYSSLRPGGPGPGNDADIYYSVNFGPSQLAEGVNTEYNDHRPNVRKDGREIVFDSDRPGFVGATPNFDIWTATRDSIFDSWEMPVHLPFPINTAANETRASLSWDGRTMYFGSNRPDGSPGGGTLGFADVYTVSRSKLRGNEK
jgi:hypothetical protein